MRDIPDYEPEFYVAVQQFWDYRDSQAARQAETGRIDAGTRGSVTGGKHLDGVADLISRVMTEAGLEPPTPLQLPGYFRRDKNWDLVARLGPAVGAVVELKSQVGSIGNNANNRIEEMIGQSVDFWTAHREALLGPVPPWFGYFMLVEDCPASQRIAVTPRKPRAYPWDPEFIGTTYIDRYAIALHRLRAERTMDEVCLVAASRNGECWYPDPTMTFQTFATAIHARGMVLRTQIEPF